MLITPNGIILICLQITGLQVQNVSISHLVIYQLLSIVSKKVKLRVILERDKGVNMGNIY